MTIEKKKKKGIDPSLLAPFPFLPGVKPPLKINPPIQGEIIQVVDVPWKARYTPTQAILFYGSLALIDPKAPFEAAAMRTALGLSGFTGFLIGGLYTVSFGVIASATIGLIFDPAYLYTGREVGQPASPAIGFINRLLIQEPIKPLWTPNPMPFVFDKWTRQGIYG